MGGSEILRHAATAQVTQRKQALCARVTLLCIAHQQVEFGGIVAHGHGLTHRGAAWRAWAKGVNCQAGYYERLHHARRQRQSGLDRLHPDRRSRNGAGNIIPGLEAALEGKQVGERVMAVIPPEQGYGIRNEELVQHLSRDLFDTDEDIVEGMRFQAMSESGPRVVSVMSVDDDQVTIDGNHPLAGMTLHFDVTIA